MSEDNSVTFQEYREEIKSSAQIVLEESENEDDLNEMVWQTVDSHQWIIYHGYGIDVLDNSDAGPQEWKHLTSDDDGWREVIQAMAFDAMRNDLWEEVRNQQKK